MFKTFFREMHPKTDDGLSRKLLLESSSIANPIFTLKKPNQWISASMTKYMDNVLLWMPLIVDFTTINNPEELEEGNVYDRFNFDKFG